MNQQIEDCFIVVLSNTQSLANFHLGSTLGGSVAETQSHAQAGEEEEVTGHRARCPCAISSTRTGTGCRHFAATRRVPLPARCRNPRSHQAARRRGGRKAASAHGIQNLKPLVLKNTMANTMSLYRKHHPRGTPACSAIVPLSPLSNTSNQLMLHRRRRGRPSSCFVKQPHTANAIC